MSRAGRLHTVAALLGLAACMAFAPAADASGPSARAAARAGWSAPVRADRGLHARFVSALSCPSAKFCAAADGAGRVVFYHGRSWSKATPVDTSLHGDDVLLGMACTYKAFCVTFNAQGDVFVYDGHHWRGPRSLWSARIYENGQVSCPTSHFCVLENGHRVYVYRHGHWSAGPQIKATGVSCSSSSFCVVTSRSGTSSFASVYRKKLRARRPLDRGSVVAGVSCASNIFCVAAGARLTVGHADGGGTVVTYRGHAWSKPTTITSAPTGPTSIACPSNRFCAAVDGAGNALTYHGSAWGAAVPVDSHAHGKPMWVSCPSSSFCMAIDSYGYAVRRR
jgi:hypothetical protein